jgi:hypothetical protein
VNGLVNFLSEKGNSYQVGLPDFADPAPDLYGVVTLDDGAREILYEPGSRKTDPSRQPLLISRFEESHDGFRVSVFEAADQPELLIAFWHLPGGYLTYALSISDDSTCGATSNEEGIRLVLSHMHVAIGETGLPTLSYDDPVRGGDPRDPFQREMIQFHPTGDVGGWPTIKLTREPAWAREGASAWTSGEMAEATVTNTLDITASVLGSSSQLEELKEYATEVAGSLTPTGTV